MPPDDIVVQDPPKDWRSLYLWNGGNGLPMLFVTGTDSTYFSLILLQLATTRCRNCDPSRGFIGRHRCQPELQYPDKSHVSFD
jgi:hypothetical protein